MAIKITLDDLCNASACWNQLSIFKAEWPYGCVVNEATIRRAIDLNLDVDWAVGNLASLDLQDKYYTIRTQAKDTFRQEIRKVETEYNEAIKSAKPPGKQALRLARVTYIKAIDLARQHYKESRARVLIATFTDPAQKEEEVI